MNDMIDRFGYTTYDSWLKQKEKELFTKELIDHKGNESKIALKLGISRGTVRKKLVAVGLRTWEYKYNNIRG